MQAAAGREDGGVTTEERARRLVGDMPWVTEHLTPSQLTDLPKQIATCLEVAIAEEREACARIAQDSGTVVFDCNRNERVDMFFKIATAIRDRA